MVTVRDVAVLAGVSPRTVSNVVNDYPYVRDETRKRVQQAIEESGYQPNQAARSLRRGRTGLIGLILPTLDTAYFSELARTFTEVADQDYTLIVDQTGGQLNRERDVVLRRNRAALFDGLIFSPLRLSSDEMAEHKVTYPLVLIGEQVESTRFDHVLIDNVDAARKSVEHLLSLGRRPIAVLGNDRCIQATALRRAGYRLALRQAGLEPDPTLDIRVGTLGRSAGVEGMARLLALPQPPDAVFCLTDRVALGALRTLATHGVRVPDDIAVTGFDDIVDGRYSTPTLSTISPDKRDIARHAMERLSLRMAGDQSPGRHDHHRAHLPPPGKHDRARGNVARGRTLAAAPVAEPSCRSGLCGRLLASIVGASGFSEFRRGCADGRGCAGKASDRHLGA